MTIARTQAAGGTELLPEILSFSSSLALDRALLREDLVGSLAHLAMLERQRIIPAAAAADIRRGLHALWASDAKGTLALPQEEDVHMAVEAELQRTIGDAAQLLHSARSRNDQVATDLKLHVRDRAARLLEQLCAFIEELVERARAESAVLLPAYTHRQRAQPVSAAYWLGSYAAGFLRDAEALRGVLAQCATCPLGVGAVSGSSLPIDRAYTAKLLGFSGPTLNGMDTVGDRDFVLDFLYATAKFMVRASRLATDIIDYTTQEFGFATLAGDISMGSSMMPQKKNPDLFELIRGKSGAAIGDLVGLLVAVKGLPSGYNRDLQEDRAPLLVAGRRTAEVLAVLRLALPRVKLNAERTRAGLDAGFTQATDLAEALVKKGLPFRQAYRKVGALVRACTDAGQPLGAAKGDFARAVDPAFDDEVLAVLGAEGAVARKSSAGGTGGEAVHASLAAISAGAQTLASAARSVPTIDQLYGTLSKP